MTATKTSEKVRPAAAKHGCGELCVHQDAVDRALSSMPDEEALYEAADFFKMFGDPTRIKILHALFVSELCVCDLSILLGVSQSAVSHQLSGLRQLNLVRYRREGKTVYYSLKDRHVKMIVDMGMKHIMEKNNQDKDGTK